MMTHRARTTALTTIALTTMMAAVMTDQLDAQGPTHWSLCGAGRYDFSANGQPLGSETFEVTCKPDGHYVATGRTQLSGGAASIDLTTNLELGPDLRPITASAKGTVQGRPFEQTGTFSNGTATLVSNGQSQTIPYAPDASWLGGNIFYTNAFIVARYDETKGGVQEFSIFPQLKATIDPKVTHTVNLPGGEHVTMDQFDMSIGAQKISLLRDSAGRLAAIVVKAQKFMAVRPEAAKAVTLVLNEPKANAASPAASAPIDYSAPPGAPFTAEEVTIPVATYKLAGTLLVPKSGTTHPAVAMITGSGLQTRDQRIPLPGLEQYAPFRQIAERLASNGVAVLRVDDRGTGESTGRETLENATTTSLAEDTRAQIAWLRTRKEIDPRRIAVIGHSEGASIAAMIGASDPKLAAVVMMAGVAKRGADVSFEQQEDMLKSDTTMTAAHKDSLRAQQKEIVKTVLAGGEVPGFNAWGREYFSYDPLPTVRKVKQPLLILQGERDRQVYEEHAKLLAQAAREAGNKDVTVKFFPTLNHLFLPSTTGSFSEYAHLSTNTVPDDVLDTLVDWFRKEKLIRP
jgi:dipeptidyl aminopeptidase/acylaminoacyl peptidase